MTKYKINKGFITQKVGKKITIFDAETSTLFTFNETASFIFVKLNDGVSPDEIVRLLIKKFSLSEKKATKDVADFISQLLQEQIIKLKK